MTKHKINFELISRTKGGLKNHDFKEIDFTKSPLKSLLDIYDDFIKRI